MPVHRRTNVEKTRPATAVPPQRTAAEQKRAWDTAQELEFVRGLGTTAFRPHGRGPLAPRRVLLERYLASMDRCREWGDINSARVRGAVERLLSEGI